MLVLLYLEIFWKEIELGGRTVITEGAEVEDEGVEPKGNEGMGINEACDTLEKIHMNRLL